ncbi:Hypothetical protein PHPALM_6047 [Phytophthora palmivora]|uniref:Peroxisome membrane anchor protein Pex14p N-terminal domain-containing protein n=1 Tax=Phytophthora palmivora TaxID=4796 RepID=A0A2P4YFT6_9STRA|nr:Hypothetical protein PHPALM_6047 [Phytophthora palmivora]
MMDSKLLLKCEDFLLHPTVRALSLAQRVDFLEKKGLSPEEITQCLKSVERRHGLSQLPVERLADVKPSSTTSKTPLKLLQAAVLKYGVVTLLLMLLGVGYVQFRRRKTEQLLLQREAEKTQHRQHMHTRVEALLALVKDQQRQYKQAQELLGARVTKFVAAQAANQNEAVKDTLTPFSKDLQLQTLQEELLDLKSAVVDMYLQPRVVHKVVEVTKDLPIVLRPAEASVTDILSNPAEVVQDGIVASVQAESDKTDATSHSNKNQLEVATASKQKDKRTSEKQSYVRDQTTMSSEEITELFKRGQVEEELSTPGSYRVLFATQ